MSLAELAGILKHMTNPERLEIIELATRLVREDIGGKRAESREERNRRMREAALEVKDLYEPGGELTEWTCLDAEEFLDDHVQG
jgi:hypothetical protein